MGPFRMKDDFLFKPDCGFVLARHVAVDGNLFPFKRPARGLPAVSYVSDGKFSEIV